MIKQLKLTDENQVKAGAAGGIEVLLKVASIHKDNLDLCKILQQLFMLIMISQLRN